ncbi:MAG: hypothetical protein J6T48_10305 [Bacteroidales bacterium]|nr:hypothetical protein [Bacteroidales bacterium]
MTNDENIEKESFLQNMINFSFDKKWFGVIVAIYSLLLLILYGISFICYWSFFSGLLSLLSGTSILFIAYIGAIIILCDIGVEKSGEWDFWGRKEPPFSSKSIGYKLTMVWFLVLLALGITAIVFTNRYRKNYAFDCGTYYVEKSVGVYHLGEHCDDISGEVEEMKGYEIREKGYTLCELCEDIADFGDDDRFIRR